MFPVLIVLQHLGTYKVNLLISKRGAASTLPFVGKKQPDDTKLKNGRANLSRQRYSLGYLHADGSGQKPSTESERSGVLQL
jgi:hypothetical protein